MFEKKNQLKKCPKKRRRFEGNVFFKKKNNSLGVASEPPHRPRVAARVGFW